MTFSVDAQRICARWFSFGVKSSLRSHPPHATLAKYGNGMAELLAAGIVTEVPYNKHGSVEYFGTTKAIEIGATERLKLAREAGLVP